MSSGIGFPTPKPIMVDEATMTDTYAKFTVQPFQAGFGHTLGNSLRRVLLSSLQGAAICAVRIDGAMHEFDSLDNVIEDVTEIILNLKRVKLNLHADGPKTLEIRKDKAGTVTAADIICDSTVEVLTPDQVICTLKKSVPFRAEIEVMVGKGYCPADNNNASRPAGTIQLDCLYSPVTRVNYQVGAARVGEETEMDSLEIEIWTDGRISPRAALETAAQIFNDHLKPFLGNEQALTQDGPLTPDELRLYKLLAQDVEVLDLSVRSMNCLNSANIKLISELCTKTESRMLKYRNCGKRSLDEIKEKIEKLGLGFGMMLSDRLMAKLENESARVRSELSMGDK